jgi:hypothetical protein
MADQAASKRTPPGQHIYNGQRVFPDSAMGEVYRASDTKLQLGQEPPGHVSLSAMPSSHYLARPLG